jgi:hypothetical protein
LNQDQLEQLYGCMSRATFGILDGQAFVFLGEMDAGWL